MRDLVEEHRVTVRSLRGERKLPSHLLQRLGTLLAVALLAGSNAVGVGVSTTECSRNYVVDGVSVLAAVGASVLVSGENGLLAERYPIPVSPVHVVVEENDVGPRWRTPYLIRADSAHDGRPPLPAVRKKRSKPVLDHSSFPLSLMRSLTTSFPFLSWLDSVLV